MISFKAAVLNNNGASPSRPASLLGFKENNSFLTSFSSGEKYFSDEQDEGRVETE